MNKIARRGFVNPFILNECNSFSIEPAPIVTNIYETYAQCNEDIIVEGVLRSQVQRSGRSMESIRYIEIGANHPFQTSSTYLLYKLYGASGVLVEPIPELAERLQNARPRDTVVNCAISTSEEPTVQFHIHEKNELSSVSMDHISMFEAFGGADNITSTIECKNMHINAFMKQYSGDYCDYFSIDVEGLDAAILTEMDHVFLPTLIQCEHEQRVDEFARILNARNYTLLAQTDVNAIFVKRETI